MENRGDAEIVRAVIAMAHGLHMVVVAEDVVTEEQRRLLGQPGCDRRDGAYFSRPVPDADVDVARFGRALESARFLS